MNLLELTLPTAAENVALDEALLLSCEGQVTDAEWLRLWEPAAPLVVLGRSSRATAEADLPACKRDGVPVLRRSSGGAAIVTAPGCLMYAVVLSCRRRPVLRAIDRAHHFVLDTMCQALAPLSSGIERAGTSDLVQNGRKFSGNSLRCLRTHLLYHGTILYGMSSELIERYLRMPPRQPHYRSGRGHEDFVVNLALKPEAIRSAVTAAFGAKITSVPWPAELTASLVAEKYERPAWNLQLM